MPTANAPASKWLVLVLVCLAQFMVVLDATIVNVAIPSITKDLTLDAEAQQWIVNGYALAFGGFLLLGGRAADLFGRKRLFLAGVALFTVASAANALAESGTTLVAARALQGLGAALVSPAALSVITTTFREGEERTKALAIWGGIAAGGGALGLLFGGVLTQWLTWEWCFLINLPIGTLGFLAALRIVPESKGSDVRGFDVLGALTVTLGLVAVVYAITKSEAWGFGDARTLAFALGGAVLLAAFVATERAQAHPLVRLGIFSTRSLTITNVAMLLVAGALFSQFLFGSIYVQQVLGLSPLEAGLAFMPFTAGIMGGSVLAQQLVGRVGIKAVLLLGLPVASAGLLWFAQLDADGSYVADVLGPVLLLASGMGLTFVPLTLAATANVASEEAGLASGIFNTAQQVGGALGIAILGTVAGNLTSNRLAEGADPSVALTDGYGLAFLVGAGLIIAGAVLLAVLLRAEDVRNVDPEAALVAA